MRCTGAGSPVSAVAVSTSSTSTTRCRPPSLSTFTLRVVPREGSRSLRPSSHANPPPVSCYLADVEFAHCSFVGKADIVRPCPLTANHYFEGQPGASNGTSTPTCFLQDGLKLDLNRLARKGFVRHGANIGVRGITWTHSYRGEIATGMISADMSGKHQGLVSYPAWQPRPVDYARVPSVSFRWSAMVFCLPCQESARLRPLEAKWCDAVLQPPDLGPASRLSIPIQRLHKPRPRWKRADQVTVDCEPRSRRMGLAAEAEMDAVGDVQTVCGRTRPLR